MTAYTKNDILPGDHVTLTNGKRYMVKQAARLSVTVFGCDEDVAKYGAGVWISGMRYEEIASVEHTSPRRKAS